MVYAAPLGAPRAGMLAELRAASDVFRHCDASLESGAPPPLRGLETALLWH